MGKFTTWFKNLWMNFKSTKVQMQSLEVFSSQITDGNTDPRKTKMYLNDPTTPELIIEEEVKKTPLQINSIGDQGNGFILGTAQQQATACKGMVGNILTYMLSKTPKKINRWAATSTLMILPRAGKDVNAFYDRSALKFFFFGDPVLKKNIYACDSRSVVTHEFGHAYLDILRPDLWSTQAAEIWAFHEAFGDMTAILENLQHDALIQNALIETGGNLLKSSCLTRLAAEMGVGLYHVTNDQGEMHKYLRDMSIVYNYIEPEKLPKVGPDEILINECHSFSRIFSTAFYELIIKMTNQIAKQGINRLQALKTARDDAATLLIRATMSVPATVRFFDAVAKQMIVADKTNGEKYQEVLNEVFSSRNILRPVIKMLDVVDMKEVMAKVKEPFEMQTHGNTRVIRTFTNKRIKLSDSMEVSALEDNPLFNLEIEIPSQIAYYFDENNFLSDVVQAQDTEIIDAAYDCLDFLHKNNLVGEHADALFKAKNGKLIRKQIICRCNKPNYCDPNAPEYGKPWKPANNAGCVGCHNKNCKPRPCDCDTPEPPKPVKTGCYTTVRTGSGTGYKVGQNISRRVC